MAKHTYSNKVFLTLKHKVARLGSLKTVNHLIRNVDSDFTRDRKLPFDEVIMIILSMSGCPIKEELLDYFDYDINTATASAFVQARAKILPDAFEELLHLFNKAYPCTETYKGFRLIAVDGSDLNIPYDSTDLDTFKSNGPIRKARIFFISTLPMTSSITDMWILSFREKLIVMNRKLCGSWQIAFRIRIQFLSPIETTRPGTIWNISYVPANIS